MGVCLAKTVKATTTRRGANKIPNDNRTAEKKKTRSVRWFVWMQWILCFKLTEDRVCAHASHEINHVAAREHLFSRSRVKSSEIFLSGRFCSMVKMPHTCIWIRDYSCNREFHAPDTIQRNLGATVCHLVDETREAILGNTRPISWTDCETLPRIALYSCAVRIFRPPSDQADSLCSYRLRTLNYAVWWKYLRFRCGKIGGQNMSETYLCLGMTWGVDWMRNGRYKDFGVR